MAAADPAFVRSVSRWLLAYPARWRTARAAEVTDLLADLAPEGARRLDLRSGIGLVRGGWATRWREHPPPGPYLAYLLLERRMPPQYRDWVRDDLEGPWYPVRRALTLGLALLCGAGTYALWSPEGADRLLVAVLVLSALLHGALRGRWTRERDIATHLVVRPGEVVTPSGRVPALVARPRVAARSWTTAACGWALASLIGCGVTLGSVGSIVALIPCGGACVQLGSTPVTSGMRTGTAVAVGIAVVAGLVLAPGAGRRVRRWAPVEQPARRTVPLGADGWSRLGAAAVFLAVSTALVPDVALALAVPSAIIAAVALPVLVATRRAVAAGGTRARAGIDVVRAVLGRPDRADRWVPGHLPATVWLPAGAVAPPAGAPDGTRAPR